MVAGFDIISQGIFLVMGLFGISVQFKELNVLLLLGSMGMISIILIDAFATYKFTTCSGIKKL